MLHSISLRAFAKINLGLKILGTRPDGYHEIRTIYQTLALHDRLQVSLRRSGRGIVVECQNTDIPSGRRNLVYQACELWRQARGYRGGIEVRLGKAIPAGSGLGGASSNAAATLLGLERLRGDRLGRVTLLKLAARLGSDVALFLWGGRVLGCGRGEEVYPLQDLPRRSCLVIFPGFPVSTVTAYRQLSLRREARLTRNRRAPNIYSVGVWPQLPLEAWGPAENDFEQVVFAKWPELGRLKNQLIRAGAETASLTGSGSAIYAIFETARQLVRASKSIPVNWQTHRTRTLPRTEYERLLFKSSDQ